jgi:hypothetical protein
MSLREALAACEAGELYWPVSLLNELEEGGQGRGLDWVAAVATRLLEQNEVENRSALIQWVNEAVAAKENRDLSNLSEKSLKIWSTRRDQLHVAVSHLYAALVYLLEGGYRDYRQSIFFAISAMSSDPVFTRMGLAISDVTFRSMQPDATMS